MKSLKLMLSVALVGVLFLYSGCGGSKKNDPSVTDVQLVKLSKAWKCTSAMKGSPPIAQTGYDNFILTVTGSPGQTTFGYSITGRPTPTSPWPASGTFTFGTDPSTLLVRDDQLPITYAVTATQLQLTFDYEGAGIAGRVNSVQGVWVMTFTPQ